MHGLKVSQNTGGSYLLSCHTLTRECHVFTAFSIIFPDQSLSSPIFVAINGQTKTFLCQMAATLPTQSSRTSMLSHH